MRIYKCILVFIGYVFFISCAEDEKLSLTSNKVNVAFSVTLPEPEEVLTRSYSDKDIKNLTVLVFDHNSKFMERIDVDESDIALDANGIKFNVVVDATPDNRTLHLIANARTPDGITDRIDLSGVNTTKTESQIIPDLTTKAITGSTESTLIDNIAPLIMWGRVTLNGVNVTTKVDNAKLLRSVACVRVKKAASGSGLNNLTITKMTIHNGMDRGYISSKAFNADVTTTPTTGNPYTASICDYTKAWSSPSPEPFAYIYERDCNTSDYMSVLLSATFNGKAGYYKIALADGDNAPVNILRNHRYTITILSVNGPGYSSIATAASSAPANNNLLRVQIMVEDTKTYPFMAADSQYWMGMSNNVFQLIGSSAGGSTSNVELCTVHSSRGITPIVTNQPAGLVTTITGSGNEYKVMGTFTNGSSIANHTMTISCDNLSLPLDVQWTNTITSYAGGASDTDSYVLDLAHSLSNWKIWIPNPTTSILHLHPTANTPGALTANAGSGMLTELTVDYYGHAYLHINKVAGRKDEVWTSALSNNTIIARKTIVAQ